jgi:predicted neutral ceramidase superfamily lipid hydrolase
MEVTLTTPVAYKKIMMLALVEELMKDVLIFSTLLVVFLFNAISFLTPLLCSLFVFVSSFLFLRLFVIAGTKKIKNTYVLPPARGTSGDQALWRVQTDGVNFQSAWNMMVRTP